jgi:hypothetical protein
MGLESLLIDVANFATFRPLEALDRVLGALNFKAADRSIEEIIRQTPALADCRVLDAIHVATALHFRPHTDGPLEIVTLNSRMRGLAEKVGFPVMPG